MADFTDERLHLREGNAADGSDAEAIGLADLAGIDDGSFRGEALVKFFEKKTGIIGIAKGSNDVALALRGEELAEAEYAHPQLWRCAPETVPLDDAIQEAVNDFAARGTAWLEALRPPSARRGALS